MKMKIITCIFLVLITSCASAESLVDKLKGGVDNILKKSQKSTEKDTSPINASEKKSNPSELCVNFNVSKDSISIANKFYDELISLDFDHEKFVNEIYSNPNYACNFKRENNTEWCNLTQDDGKLILGLYKNFKNTGSVGKCPWGLEYDDLKTFKRQSLDMHFYYYEHRINILKEKIRNEKYQKKEEAENIIKQNIETKKTEELQDAANKFPELNKEARRVAAIKGEKISAASRYKYKLKILRDELTRKDNVVATTQIKIGDGVIDVEASCVKDEKYLNLNFTFNKIGIPSTTTSNGRTFSGARIRTNEIISTDSLVRSAGFNNVYDISIGRVINGDLRYSDLPYNLYTAHTSPTLNGTEILYDYALELRTTNGNVFIDIPLYSDSFKKLIASCRP
jgi:hypothetical protein